MTLSVPIVFCKQRGCWLSGTARKPPVCDRCRPPPLPPGVPYHVGTTDPDYIDYVCATDPPNLYLRRGLA